MKKENHIPYLKTISDFYTKLRIGTPQGNDFSIMRIEDQPPSKILEMPLFRCNFFRIVFINNTGVNWQLPDQQFESTEDCIYFAYPGKLESWITSNKIFGYLVCFTESFLASQHFSVQDYPFFSFGTSHLLTLTKVEAERLTHQQEELIAEINSNREDTKEMLAVLLSRYLIELRRLFTALHMSLPKKKKNDQAIFERFTLELDQYFAELSEEKSFSQPNVSLIADKLSLTASYLNSVLKNVSGKTASKLIQEKTILEAKSYLMHTNLQVSEIAYRLGFTNAPYFNKFFKKWTSMSPSAFKNMKVS